MGCATPSAGPAACTVTGSIESVSSTSHDARAELPRPDVLAAHFGIDPGIVFLNHGSFGATPRAVREAQARAVDLVERDSTRFYVELLEDLLAESRSALASFVGAAADDLMIVANVPEAAHTVFHSAKLEPGDEILVTSHEYPACVRSRGHSRPLRREGRHRRTPLADVQRRRDRPIGFVPCRSEDASGAHQPRHQPDGGDPADRAFGARTRGPGR